MELYGAAEHDDRWASVLATFGRSFTADTSHLFLLTNTGAVVETLCDGYDAAANVEYYSMFLAADPRMHISRSHPGRSFSDVDVIDPALFERSEIYNEVLVPFDIRYTLFTTYAVTPGLTAAQAFMRTRKSGAFDTASAKQLDLLLPHFRQAIRLRQTLVGLKRAAGDVEAALDAAPATLIVLDRRGRVLATSKRASALIARRDLLVRQGQLSSSRPEEAAALGAAVKDVVDFAETRRSQTMTKTTRGWKPAVVQIKRAERAILSLLLLPLCEANSLEARSHPNARVMVVIHDPESRHRLDPEIVASVLGLTPTEARLAVAIAEGKSARDFAVERGSSEHTVRTQLKAVFEKTDTHGQADLVRLLIGSGAFHQT